MLDALPTPFRPLRALAAASAALILGSLAAALVACSTPPPPAPAPAGGPPVVATKPLNVPMVNPTIVRAKARWVPADWSDLPGWNADHVAELWPAFLRSCERPSIDWAVLCVQAREATTPAFSDDAARAWFQQRLRPYRVESLEGNADGLITGYFEPLVEATRTPRGKFRIPLYAPPADLATRKPYWTRQQIDTLPAAQKSLRGRAMFYVADPLDALILQIQGSGRLDVIEANGRHQVLRVAYAAHNGEAYKSVGRWLIDQGELQAVQASWPGIKAWAKQNPKRVHEMMWANPRYVFFREEAMPDPQVGPKGAQGVPLTPARSIAVDPLAMPYGTPVWLDTTEPLSNTPLRRAVVAQDTGTAISGAVRADYFWGWGDEAEQQAGRMKQPLHVWVLWPRP